VSVTWQRNVNWSREQRPLAADRYRAVFSLGEINPNFGAQHEP
jgi:hypothetical protein